LHREELNALAYKRGHDKGANGLSSRARLLSRVFAQIAGRGSLRAVQKAFKPLAGERGHLGPPPGPVAKSTLARANEKRPAKILEEIFYKTRGKPSRRMRPGSTRRLKLKSPLRLVDSTTVELRFQTRDLPLRKTAKSAVKPRLGSRRRDPRRPAGPTSRTARWPAPMPCRISTTPLSKGAIVVLDRGCVDCDRFHSRRRRGAAFVTRAKESIACDALESRGLTAPDGKPQTTGQDAKPRVEGARGPSHLVLSCINLR
jgi:putative transposase